MVKNNFLASQGFSSISLSGVIILIAQYGVCSADRFSRALSQRCAFNMKTLQVFFVVKTPFQLELKHIKDNKNGFIVLCIKQVCELTLMNLENFLPVEFEVWTAWVMSRTDKVRDVRRQLFKHLISV